MAQEKVSRRKAKGRKETPKKGSSEGRNRKKAEAKEIADAFTGATTPVGKFALLYPEATIGDMARFCLSYKEHWEAFYKYRKGRLG